ncbi:lipoate--protein ligase family protein [Thalassoglobus sp.]|uniref:lipoate--protein ligase family protein n=1 Tax=Thalassoglobus sp. TaxID=2795869 RepID=UPI003AA7B3A4
MPTSMPSCDLLVHGPLTGEENMAVDARMLEAAVAGQATLRTYQWVEPTVSLGHFQVTTSAEIPERFANLAVVKRLSGGGAILHDEELTYSIALPKAHPLCSTPSRIYNEVHECIIELLLDEGITSHLRGDAAFAEKPFLCFGRGDERDIVIGDHKIVGSAQRRRQGAVLQHGSILLAQSEYAPEFPGIRELTQKVLDPSEFASKLRATIFKRLFIDDATPELN